MTEAALQGRRECSQDEFLATPTHSRLVAGTNYTAW